MIRVVAIALLLTPFIAFGAVRDVVLTAAPERPEPNASVRMTATLIGADPKDTIFTWLMNDEVVREGIGASSIETIAPSIGETVTVRVLTNGAERAAPYVLSPARVTLEWEAITDRPPFFVGRPLLGGQGTLRVQAFAEFVDSAGRRVPSSDIRYTWAQGGATRTDISGYGADSVTFGTKFFGEPFSVSVLAETKGGQSAAKIMSVDPVPLDVAVYESSPLGGLLDHTEVTGNYPFSSSEVTFMAYPLYASRPEFLRYSWSLNGTPATIDTGDPRRVVFKKVGEGVGQFEVSITLESAASFLDLARRTFLLHF